MLGQWGKTWPLMFFWLLFLVVGTSSSIAADTADNPLNTRPGWTSPILAGASQSVMEAQLLGDKPFSRNSPLIRSANPAISKILPGLGAGLDDGAAMRLPHNLELRISFLYNGDQDVLKPERPIHSHLLFKYSMNYSLLPNLRVGLSGFLYHPSTKGMYFQSRYGDMVMGFGPGIKYDLGRWSFTIQSQLDTGNRDRGKGLHNWFRVWYAF